MLWHILKTAFGQFRRHRFHTLITITGLSFGLAACLLIVLFLRHELSYEDHYPKADRIARVVFDFPVEEGGYLEDCTSPPALGPAMKRELPAVEKAVTLFPPWGFNRPVKVDGKTRYEEKFYFASDQFFEVFDTPFLQGNPETAFSAPDAMVLTRTAADTYFEGIDPIGKLVNVGSMNFTVTGVVPDPPENSHFHYSILARIDAFWGTNPDWDVENDWGYWNFYTYVLLQPGVTALELEAAFPAAMAKYDDTPEGERSSRAHIQPVKSIHLESHRRWELESNGDIGQVQMFALVAGLVLLIACFNTMNLTLARSTIRGREVGVRKSMGANRPQLILLFLVESLLLALVSFGVALMLAEIALPWFTRQLGTQLELASLQDSSGLGWVVGGILLVTLLSGTWPAILLSRPHPAAILKGEVAESRGRIPLRKLLVTLQFAITVGLIVSTGVIRNQLQYIHSHDIGLDRSKVLTISLNPTGASKAYNAMKEELLNYPVIEHVAASSGLPGGVNWTTRVGVVGQEGEIFVNYMRVDPELTATLGVSMVWGHDFDPSREAEYNRGVLLNETAAKAIQGDPVGATLTLGDRQIDVIGVVKDFNFQSMRDEIAPFAFVPSRSGFNYMMVRFAQGHDEEALNLAREAWNKVLPDAPFEATYLDDIFAELHASDASTSRLVAGFSLFAILIATLGLMGLSAFAAQRRTKEITVRKVLGASSRGLVALLAREFFWLVLVAAAIALPVSGWLMARWLEDFAYRTSLHAGVFLEAVVLVLVVAVLTAASQALRVVRRNPSASLRHE
ncbi:ABC transporter permease [bacterium]|nr:ABC transporter permease [bacterium]